MNFRNTTVYMIPVWFGNLADFSAKLKVSGKWQRLTKDELSTNYLLHYAHRIAVDAKRFQAFRLTNCGDLPVYMFEDEFDFPQMPEINEIRFSCFGTGVGFLEFFVAYGDLPINAISEFAYKFKKATKAKTRTDGKISLYTAAQSLIPEGSDAELFFDCTAQFKYECRCLHMIKAEGEQNDEAYLYEQLNLLKRSYNSNFKNKSHAGSSEYDMIYEPYDYDKWGGSQEALVNIVCETGQQDTDFFVNNYKYEHLYNDYHFLYLLLLNQRFSAVHYIAQIAESEKLSPREFDKLNKRVVQLKTSYSFRVVSNDQFYQNVYSKMYKILDIDFLLDDIQDNESQMAVLQSAHSVKTEKMTSKFLFGISLLSLFSALIDAAGFFDRMGGQGYVSTLLSLVCVIGIVIICIIWLLSGDKRF